MSKNDNRGKMATIIAALALVFTLACAANEIQNTPLSSDDASAVITSPDDRAARPSVAPVSVEDAIRIAQSKTVSVPAASEVTEAVTGPELVSVVSNTESYASVETSRASLETVTLSSSVAPETPVHGISDPPAIVESEVGVGVVDLAVEQTSKVGDVEPSQTLEAVIGTDKSSEQRTSENETVATAIPPEQVPPVVVVLEPEPPTVTPELAVVTVEPTPVPATYGNEVGDNARLFLLPSVDGPEYRLEDQIGRNVVLIFYRAYW